MYKCLVLQGNPNVSLFFTTTQMQHKDWILINPYKFPLLQTHHLPASLFPYGTFFFNFNLILRFRLVENTGSTF